MSFPSRATAAIALGLTLAAIGPATALADTDSVRWAPPTLTNPTTIQLGQGVTHTVLDKSKDYIVKLPAYTKVGGTEIEGGHNVVIQGGHISIPPNLTNDAARRGIYLKDNTGTVHIEGVLIDAQPGAISDGIDISAPDATVQIENDRIVKMSGGLSTFHADVIQPWGGVKDLRIDRLTGSSNYQGLYLAQDLGRIGRVELSNINLSQTAGPYDGGGHMLWITSGVSSCTSYPLTLSNVYIQPRVGRSLNTSVWPQVGSSLACPAVPIIGGITWLGLGVSGGVSSGVPAGGDYVPSNLPGLAYVSRGYGGDSPSSGSGSGDAPVASTPPDASDPAPPQPAPVTAAAPATSSPSAAPSAPAARRTAPAHRVLHKKHKAKKKKAHHHKKRHHKKRKRRHHR